MKIPARHNAVLAGGKNHQPRVRCQVGSGKGPELQVERRIRHSPVGEIDRARAGILEFDPIRFVPILIPKAGEVGAQEFRDRNRILRKRRQAHRHGCDRNKAQSGDGRDTPMEIHSPSEVSIHKFKEYFASVAESAANLRLQLCRVEDTLPLLA